MGLTDSPRPRTRQNGWVGQFSGRVDDPAANKEQDHPYLRTAAPLPIRTSTVAGPFKGTPKPVLARLNAAVRAVFADPATQTRFRDVGMVLPPRERQTPEALFAHHKAEIDKWWPIIKAAGIKAP